MPGGYHLARALQGWHGCPPSPTRVEITYEGVALEAAPVSAKLKERCSDAVKDQAAEETSWGQQILVSSALEAVCSCERLPFQRVHILGWKFKRSCSLTQCRWLGHGLACHTEPRV
jgi:hypothetical protein